MRPPCDRLETTDLPGKRRRCLSEVDRTGSWKPVGGPTSWARLAPMEFPRSAC